LQLLAREISHSLYACCMGAQQFTTFVLRRDPNMGCCNRWLAQGHVESRSYRRKAWFVAPRVPVDLGNPGGMRMIVEEVTEKITELFGGDRRKLKVADVGTCKDFKGIVPPNDVGEVMEKGKTLRSRVRVKG
jgi:hypothetical protein